MMSRTWKGLMKISQLLKSWQQSCKYQRDRACIEMRGIPGGKSETLLDIGKFSIHTPPGVKQKATQISNSTPHKPMLHQYFLRSSQVAKSARAQSSILSKPSISAQQP